MRWCGLTDLGLRSTEVVKLQLDDINWADGTIKLVGTKSRRTEALPLPSATGAAIAAYLPEERPATSNRVIFVRDVAPYDEPITTKRVKRAVLAGYRRCGWMLTGVHILRHSMASRLLRTGAPMADEGDCGHPAASKPRYVRHLRKSRSDQPWSRGLAVAGERAMTGARTMLSLAKDYLSERRALGFALRMEGHQITSFAQFATGAAIVAPSPTISS